MQQGRIINPIDEGKVNFLYDFIIVTESLKYQCKLFHWMSKVNSEHQLLDSLYFDLIQYQDDVVEDYLGVYPGILKAFSVKPTHTFESPKDLIKGTLDFINNNLYPSIQQDKDFKGVISLTDEFIHKLHKYLYLLDLV